MTYSHITFVGDFFPTTTDNVNAFISSSALVANLECSTSAYPRQVLKSQPIVLELKVVEQAVRCGFSALNLANNHAYDAGERELENLILRLEKITSLGIYGVRKHPFVALTVGDFRVAIIGCMEPCRSCGPLLFPQEKVARLIRDLRPQYDRIFVTPHWGKEGEYAHHPSPEQRKLAVKWIDAGADAVIGHHSHTIHGRETFGGKPVYYSVGNFHFAVEEQKRYPLASYGIAVRWNPGDSLCADSWSHDFIYTGGLVPDIILDARRAMLDDFFDAISHDLIDKARPWTLLRWASAVGGIYFSKSDRSWKIRFSKSFLRTFPIWVAWNVLPKTLLLRLGQLMGNREFELRICTLEKSLALAAVSPVEHSIDQPEPEVAQ